MAMTTCKECKKEVSDRAKLCPHCGVKNPGITAMQMMMTFAVIVALLWWFVWPDSEEAQAGILTQEQFGKDWPFTVDEGTVYCEGQVAIFQYDGDIFKLNGVNSDMDFKPLASIWRDNPDLPGTKISLSPILSLALDKCH